MYRCGNGLRLRPYAMKRLRRAYTNNCLVHSRVWEHIVGGSKINIMPEHVVYSLMRRLRIFYQSIKIIQFIFIFFFFDYFIYIARNSATKFSI